MPTKNSNNKVRSRVLETAPAAPAAAHAHFAAKLELETDASDVWTDLQNGTADFDLVDPRGTESFAKEHIPGAINLPYRQIDPTTTTRFSKDRLIVVYCAGVHCNASTKGAMRLTKLGFRVKELLDGLEGWKLEGYPVEGDGTSVQLTAKSHR